MGRRRLAGRFGPAAVILCCLAVSPSKAQAPASTEESGATEAPAPAVVVAPAEMQELNASAGFTGRVVAVQKVEIRARVTGFLEDVAFREGDRVEAGQLLYSIQDEAYRASVAEIEGSIQAAEAARDLARIERDRKAKLVARDAVAQRDLDIAKAKLGQAEGELAHLQGTLDRARLDLSYTRITAPFAGVIGLSAADVGALVGPDSGPLTTLMRLDPIEVTFPVATSVLLNYQNMLASGDLTRESSIRLTLPNGEAYPHAGSINYVSADVAQGTDTVLVRALFDNPDGTLLDGALVGVTFEANNPNPVLTVPQQAVQHDQAGAFVMVVDKASKVELRRVEIARVEQGRAVVAKGLEEGENVIVEGINKVRPGIVVDAAVGG